jgi:uncharacterized protein (DUF2235 family)
MPKNIIICSDGTGNEIGTNCSNVLKLFRVLEKNEQQRVYYHPGVGTIGLQSSWGQFKQTARGVLGFVTGAGLDEDVLRGYRFLCQNYQDGDRVFLFGFSRGAYTVRALAAFVHVMGLLPPDQIDLAGYAFSSYKTASSDSQRADGTPDDSKLKEAWQFREIARGRPIDIEFVGVWDTVASVIVPRQDSFWLDMQTLRFTRTNNSVKKFRHAMSIDEQRRMFRLNRWTVPQSYRSDPFDAATAIDQDIRQVWFAGVHGDVGGGYPEKESGLSKFPLAWMVEQARAAGLSMDQAAIDHLVWGTPAPRSSHYYVAPDAAAALHVSLTGLWQILEWLPKRDKWKEWPQRKSWLGWYLPRGEPRLIPNDAVIHRSVIDRKAKVPSYQPINLPALYTIEEGPSPSAPASGEVTAGSASIVTDNVPA